MPEEIKQDEKPAPPKEPTNYPALAGRVATLLISCYIMWTAMKQAYFIRLFAINTYGRVIHEFDPWFNFRATQYLLDNGWTRFFQWFDYMSWYPLGRPVGTTIYPGMQILSVGIYHALRAAHPALGASYATLAKLLFGDQYTKKDNKPVSINDVCVFVPAWCGSLATVLLALLTAECTGSALAGAAGSLVMAIVPAHIMRSVAGGFDNESVAISAMLLTFALWVRATRGAAGCGAAGWTRAEHDGAARGHALWGALAGLGYTCMVASWGGFIFVTNLIALHAFVLVCLGRFGKPLHRA